MVLETSSKTPLLHIKSQEFYLYVLPLVRDLSEKFLGMWVGKLSKLFEGWWPRISLGTLDFFLSRRATLCTTMSVFRPTNASQMYFMDSARKAIFKQTSKNLSVK